MNRCGVIDTLTPKGCTGPRPCPLHDPDRWWDVHGHGRESLDPELHAIGGVGGDNDTSHIYTGPLAYDVKVLRDQGVPPTVIAALWTDLCAVYRRWERRELKGPQYAVHGRHGWLIHGGDRDKEPRGLWTDNVDLAQRFDHPDEAITWCDELDLFHSDYPRNMERVGLRAVRVL